MPNPKLEELEEEKRREQPKAPPHHHGGLLGKYTNVEIFAYVLAGSSAIAATWSSIGRMFADKISDLKWVVDLKQTRLDQRNQWTLQREQGEISIPEFLSKMLKSDRDFKTAYSTKLKEEWGVKNTVDKWRMLQSHQKIGTALSILGVLSIAGVAIYSIAKERIARNKLEEEREKRIEAQEQIKIHEKQHQQQEVAAEEKSVKTPPVVMGDKTKALLESREALPSDMAFPTL